jgi:hypothetical protein
MNARRSLLVVPNHSMVIEGDLLRIEWAEAELLRAVRERFAFAGIAAFVEGGNNSSLAGSVPRAHAASHRLNQLDHSRSRLARLINYVGAATICCTSFAQAIAVCWRLAGRDCSVDRTDFMCVARGSAGAPRRLTGGAGCSVAPLS